MLSRSTAQRLTAEKFLFLQKADPYGKEDDDRVRLFSKRIVDIWNEGHSSWQDRALDAEVSGKGAADG